MMRSLHYGVTNTRRLTILAIAAVALLAIVAAFGVSRASAGAASSAGLGVAAPLGQAGAEPGGADSVTATCPTGGQCFADMPASNPFYDNANRIYEQEIVGGYACGGPGEPCDSANRPYFRWGANVTRGQLSKFVDLARRQPGFVIDTNLAIQPFYVNTTAPNIRAIEGRSESGYGVLGVSNTEIAIYGHASGNQPAIYGFANGPGNGIAARANASEAAALWGENTGSGRGVYGKGNVGPGVFGISNTGIGVVGIGNSASYAIQANGDLRIVGGTCDGCAAATYTIDHPADPTNKYLNHASVVSDEQLNVYNGNVTLDARGEATVSLPSWFEAVNKDYRYQLTAVGAAAPGLFVSQKIKDGRFKISGGAPGGEISWQVTGVRHDRFAEANPLTVEQEKPAAEKGTYLSPALYGRPESAGASELVK